MARDQTASREPFRTDPGFPPPDPWLVAALPLLAAGLPGAALDLACGRGQNALCVAALGATTVGLDASVRALEAARLEARRRSLAVSFVRADAEEPTWFSGTAGWGTVLVFHFLHRPLFDALQNCLAPGGLLIYKTHLDHPLRGTSARPRRTAFLLRPGELLSAFPRLHPLAYREWAWEGEAYAALLARQPHSL